MRSYADIERHLHSDLGTTANGGFGNCLSDDSFDTVCRQSLADSFYKKLCPLGVTKEQDLKALKKFQAINSKLPETSYDFSADTEAESCFWDYLRDNFNRSLQPNVGRQVFESGLPVELSDAPSKEFDLNFIRQNLNIGPGAAQKADPSSIVTKLFEGEMSYTNTEHLIKLYRSALVGTRFWADAERLRFERFGFTRVDGGKIFFVKKNSEISRTCCTEPNLNMMFQKAAGAFIEERLRVHFGIDLSTQPIYNRRLARTGSIDGSFGTIDLVSASDSVGLQMFLRLLDECPLKDMILMSRSESVTIPSGEQFVLRMVSTMGNGFTFPLQTLIFASAVRAVYQLMGFPCDDNQTQYGVFGDDIVVRFEAYTFLCRMLTKLGFEVNDKKSFNSGPFRESCGGDYFKGLNVRGVYVTTLETSQDICSCINRLNRWSARTGIGLHNLIHYLKWQVPDAPRVPFSESDDAGLKVPFSCTQPRVDSKYWFAYRKYKQRESRMEVPEVDFSVNPHGSAIGYLSGHYRRVDRDPSFDFGVTDKVPNGLSHDNPRIYITPRGEMGSEKRYKIVSDAIPFWDYADVAQWELDSYAAWKGYVARVLTHPVV